MDAANRRADTLASAIEINRPVNLPKALRALERCGGVVREVTDQEILDAKAKVGAGGLGCEPASAASVAGLRKLLQEGVIAPDERVVCILTGHLLKDPNATVAYHTRGPEDVRRVLGKRGVKRARSPTGRCRCRTTWTRSSRRSSCTREGPRAHRMKTHIAINGACGRMGQRLVALAKEDHATWTSSPPSTRRPPAQGRDAGEVAGSATSACRSPPNCRWRTARLRHRLLRARRDDGDPAGRASTGRSRSSSPRPATPRRRRPRSRPRRTRPRSCSRRT